MEVSLQDILLAREQRVARQNVFLQAGYPIISFCMNIPGPVKNSPEIERAFYLGVSRLKDSLPILKEEIRSEHTGCEAIFSVDMPAQALKDFCIGLEDSLPLGRLWDMDVLTPTGEALTRSQHRGCLVCGKPGRLCAATRAHNITQLQQATGQLIREYFAASDCKAIGALAKESLIYEVNVTPKPGLVDRRNNGSHQDMDLPLFLKSAQALESYFTKAVEIGMTNPEPETCFSLLRQAGLDAEQAMFAATGGVNTHKGAIFTLGLLCGAVGATWTPGVPFVGVQAVLSASRDMCYKALQADLDRTGLPDTFGRQLYQDCGITGIRGEAMAGFPHLLSALEFFEHNLHAGENDAGLVTLLHLISQIEDTNLYHRGGAQGAEFAKKRAKALLPNPKEEDILLLDDVFIEKNLSPGGSADLLAATWFLHKLKYF